jgi:hypothetical protein
MSSKAFESRLARLEQVAAPVDNRPWIRIVVDGETPEEAYKRVTGLPLPADEALCAHNIIFRMIVDAAPG